MKKHLVILALVVAVCVPTSCERVRLREARSGLEGTVAGLPKPDDFHQVALISNRAWDRVFGGECYYAQSIVVFGSSLSAQAALATYIDALLLQGWAFEQDLYEREKMLSRGTHERLVVSVGPPGALVELNAEYQGMKSAFPTFLVVTVDFVLPNNRLC